MLARSVLRAQTAVQKSRQERQYRGAAGPESHPRRREVSMKFAGIDWATETHFAALIDGDGEVLSEWSFSHSFDGLTSFVVRMKKEGGPAGVIVCVEIGAPLVVDQLLHAGFTVYAINPKQADRYRDRYTVAGAKDDRRDALVLAQAVRTDRATMRPVEKDSDLAEEIRIRDRARTRKVEERTRLSNQLRQTLSRYFPVLIELGREMHDSFFLALLRVCPDPASAKKVRTPRLTRLVEEHRIRAIDAKDLAKRLRAPALTVADYVAASCRDEVLDLVAQVELLNGQIAAADEKLDELTEGHPDHELRGRDADPGCKEALGALLRRLQPSNAHHGAGEERGRGGRRRRRGVSRRERRGPGRRPSR